MKSKLVLLVFVLFEIVSCSKSDPEQTRFELISRYTNGEYLKKKVTFVQSQENQIAIIIDSLTDEHKGNRCFLVCFENPCNHRFIEGRDIQAEIVYFYDGLIVSETGSNEVYFLGIDDISSKYWINNIENQYHIKFKECLLGYSLSSHKRSINIPDKLSKVADVFSLFEGLSTENEIQHTKGTSCSSGGPGSTSCSINDVWSGCSVTCKEGYYACCKSGSNVCKCIKDPPSYPTK